MQAVTEERLTLAQSIDAAEHTRREADQILAESYVHPRARDVVAAHLGGAAYGLLYWWLLIRRPPRVRAPR